MRQSVYDTDGFFELYQKLRQNPISLNEIVEKPTMLSLLPDLKGKRLLDMGCGCGEHLRLYLQRQAEFVVGIDLSKKMLQQARQNLAEFAPHFALYRCSMEHVDQLEEKAFDLVTGSFAFHYVEDFAALLQKIAQKLVLGGKLIFSQEHPIVTCYRAGNAGKKIHKNSK